MKSEGRGFLEANCCVVGVELGLYEVCCWFDGATEISERSLVAGQWAGAG